LTSNSSVSSTYLPCSTPIIHNINTPFIPIKYPWYERNTPNPLYLSLMFRYLSKVLVLLATTSSFSTNSQCTLRAVSNDAWASEFFRSDDLPKDGLPVYFKGSEKVGLKIMPSSKCPFTVPTVLLDTSLPGWGSGLHPTTYLVLQYLIELRESTPSSFKRVVDYGCGSGILLLACQKLGLGSVSTVGVRIEERRGDDNHFPQILMQIPHFARTRLTLRRTPFPQHT
jgi:hypothetical protein